MLQTHLRRRERLAFTGGAELLPVTGRSIHRVIEPHAREHALQILDVHPRGETLPAARAHCAFTRVSGLLIELDPQLSGPLENVEKLSEWQIEQSRNHCDRMEQRQE